MRYYMSHLVEATGLNARTLRTYMARGLLPKPDGHGLAATYSDEHLARAVTIARLRNQGEGIDAIAERIDGWNLGHFKRFVAKTEPEPEPVSEPEPAVSESVAVSEAEAVAEPARGREPRASDLALPGGANIQLVQLLPGLVLMVDANAPILVRRIAAEICERYRTR